MFLFILLLIFTGCGRKEKTIIPERKHTGPVKMKSRFGESILPGPEKTVNLLTDTAYFPYYIPGYPIESMNPLKHQGFGQSLSPVADKNKAFRHYDQTGYTARYKKGITSPEVYFSVIFDNDIIDYTDYYFTNGAGFELFHPLVSASPFARLLPGLSYSSNFYALTLVQNLYTPLKLNKPEILTGDRPFAAYLTVGHHRISLSPEKKQRLSSGFIIGVLGPGSMGNFSQAMIHSEEPTGWKYQVKNDIVLNYAIRFEQAIFSMKGMEAAIVACGQAGTLYDNLVAGVYFQAGRANDRYSSIFQTTDQQKPYRKRIRYYFSLDLSNRLVIYDATLQGGMFNKESVYTINRRDIKRYVFTGTASMGIGFGKYSLEAEQVFLTPEFDGGRRHMWFRIKNIVRLN